MSLRAWLRTPEGRRLALLAVVAVALRLALMPFTLHFDAYQIYSRASEAAYGNQWFGFTSQIIIQTLHNLWLLLLRPFLPDSAAIWSDTASVIGVGASREDYERFLDYPHVYRAIFLMKLPYVIADLACAWLLARLVSPARRLGVAAFWLLNPLVIFSTAVYGRHDSLAILLVLLSIVAARRATDGWRLVGLALLGIATLTRFFPVLLIPAYLLAFRRTQRQLALFLGLLAGMVAIVELAGVLTSGRSTLLTIAGSYEHLQYWFDAGLYLRFGDWIMLFPVAYALGLLWLSERGLTPEEYPLAGAAAFLLLFSLTFFHPHYSIWLVPFLALVLPLTARMLTYHAIQIVCIFVYSAQWGAWTTWALLEPLVGERVRSLPDPVETISAQIEPRIFFGFFRSLLTAISLWMLWRLLRAWRVGRPSIPHTTPVLALVALLLTACSTTVSGYSSPIAHDHAPLNWLPLDTPVEQPFVAGTGYAVAVGEDGSISPEELQARLAALPEDARSGTLDELRVGLRLDPAREGAWSSGARLQMVYAPRFDLRFPERDFYHWHESDIWLPPVVGEIARQTFVSPYPDLAGIEVRISTLGGDLSAGDALIGGAATDVWTLPFGGEYVTTLPPGTHVWVTGSAEGWARVELPQERSGFVPLAAFSLLPEPASRPQRPLRLTLLDASGNLLRSTEVPAEELRDNAHLLIPFEPLPDSQGAAYVFTLSVSDEPGHPGVLIRATTTERYAEGTRLEAGMPVAGEVVFRPHYAPSPPLLDREVDRTPRHGDWLVIDDPPHVPDGLLVALRLVPGAGPDASHLRYGLTPGRVPYGGVRAVDAQGVQQSGALLVQTSFTRNVALRSILADAARRLRSSAGDDLPFTLAYVLGLGSLSAAGVWLWRGNARLSDGR
jgi:hypothetical protein